MYGRSFSDDASEKQGKLDKSSRGKVFCIISQLKLTMSLSIKEFIYDNTTSYKVHSLFSAVEDATSGKTPFKYLENFIDRLARVSSC